MKESLKNLDRYYCWMNVPILYRNKLLKDFKGYIDEVRTAKETIEKGKSLFLSGKCGTGKTHLAVALMVDWLYKTKPEQSKEFPQFLPAVEFFVELKNTFDGNGSEKDVLDKYSLIPLLVIDDIGAEKITDWSRQSFYTLVDRRYRMMKQTIITSNLSLGDISKLIDDRISSRIVEMGIIIELNGNDFRLSLNH